MDKIKKWLPLGAAVAGVLALILFLACNSVVTKETGDALGSGWETTFGKKKGELTILEFSFMNFLTVLLVIAATACSVLSYLKPENKLFAMIAAACFAVSAIFFFSTKGFVLTANDWKSAADSFKLGFGSVIGAILSVVGAGAVITPVVLKA